MINTKESFLVTVSVCPPMSDSVTSYDFEISPLFVRELEPVHEVDIPLLGLLDGASTCFHTVAKARKMGRKQLVEQLAKELAERIEAAFSKGDTLNGYPVSGTDDKSTEGARV